MVGISGCGSENTFWLSQTFSIWPAAISSPLSPPSLCFSYAFVSKHKRFIAHMLAFVVHILCICICLSVCVKQIYFSMYIDASTCLFLCVCLLPSLGASEHLYILKRNQDSVCMHVQYQMMCMRAMT